ncbi:MAG: hypothetical protein DMG82_06375 [Acidobacteria bacterium]|nr:MAG: hypothetical protein DMG82_06375 [Acidobacteriota bacterium]
MRIPKFPGVSVAIAAAFSLLFLLPACSLNVKKNEKGEGEKVDIQTPVGGIHVSQDANPRDTGLATYPGARPKEKSSQHDGNNANVNISSGFFGIKVVAIEFVSDDPPEKVAAFYRDQLKKYGAVLECHTDNPHQDAGDVDVDLGKDDKAKSKKLTCEHDSGKSLELKVGTKDNQHVVSISPQDKGKGTDFALVFVQARGSSKDTI